MIENEDETRKTFASKLKLGWGSAVSVGCYACTYSKLGEYIGLPSM